MFGVMQRGELRHGAADCGLRVCRAAVVCSSSLCAPDSSDAALLECRRRVKCVKNASNKKCIGILEEEEEQDQEMR